MKENNEIKSTAHSKYRCQYHIVFAPKFRRKEIYGQLRKDIGEILRKLCEQKGVEIIEAEACPDHIHMLVSIPPYISIAQFMGYLKGKSSLMIFDRHANLKYKYGSRNFWCRGYYVDTVGRNKKVIAEYIRNQLEEDYTLDQMSIKEYTDPFTGSKNRKAKKKTAARERLPVMIMRCQTFWAPLGALPVVAPFRGCASHRFTGGSDSRQHRTSYSLVMTPNGAIC